MAREIVDAVIVAMVKVGCTYSEAGRLLGFNRNQISSSIHSHRQRLRKKGITP